MVRYVDTGLLEGVRVDGKRSKSPPPTPPTARVYIPLHLALVWVANDYLPQVTVNWDKRIWHIEERQYDQSLERSLFTSPTRKRQIWIRRGKQKDKHIRANNRRVIRGYETRHSGQHPLLLGYVVSRTQ
jgi:hypothetical protein